MGFLNVKGWWILPIVLLSTVTFIVTMSVSRCQGKKTFVEGWDFGKYAAGKCVFGSFPVVVRNCLASRRGQPCVPSKTYEKEYEQAFSLWRAALGSQTEEILMNDVRGDHPHAVPLFAEHPDDGKAGQPCEPILWNMDDFLVNHAMAVTRFPDVPGYVGAHIMICTKKFEQMRTRLASKTADNIKRFGMHGLIAHEIGHLLVGPKHPDPYALLMSANPEVPKVSETTKRLVQYSHQQCRKKHDQTTKNH